MRKNLSLLLLTVFALSIGACANEEPTSEESKNNTTSINNVSSLNEESSLEDYSSDVNSSSNEEASSIDQSSSEDNTSEEPPVTVTYLSVSEAVALANQVGEDGTEEKQYVTGYVKSITNANYGEMYITDGTNDLYIYGVYSADGTKRYPDLENKPYTGDEVFLYGFVKTYNGNPEMGASWLQKMVSHQGEVDLNDYTESTVLAARSAVKGSKVRVSGVVAKINHANGMVPNGFYLIDNTSSIYVYSKEIAGRVEEGEEIEVAGTRDDYIIDSELALAQQFGYLGAIQLTDAIFVKSNGKNKEFNKTWIENTTVKAMMETPLTNNITSKVFKVNAIINKAPGSGFVNYYINDLDNRTGSYVYSMCNGSDFGYLNAYDGKICTVYLAIHNAKSTKSGIVYRLMPIAVEENQSFSMSDDEIINFALNYYSKEQFLEKYNSDPELEVMKSVSNEFIPFENVALSYESDNTSLINFVNEDDKLMMHVYEGNGTVNVTLKGAYNGKNASIVIQVKVENVDLPETLTVAEVIDTADNETVTVRGIVMSSLVNQTGFYLNDGTGVIAIRTDKTTIGNIELGNEVVMQGVRKHVVKDGSSNKGQSCVDNATLVANLMGKNAYDTSTFITDKTLDELVDAYKNAQATIDLTTNVYVVECQLRKNAGGYSTNYYLSNAAHDKEFYLYAGSGGQYADFDAFSDGRTFTATFMLCDWNTKSEYRACLISASDGTTTVVNSLNFK